MSSPASLIRDYAAGDLDRLLELESEAGARGPTGCVTSPSDLIESLSRSDYGAVSLMVAERAGEIAGYASLTPEIQIGRAVLRWRVRADRGGGRIAGKLIDEVILRNPSPGIETIHANIWQGSPAARELLSGRGFGCIRRYLELRLDLSKTDAPEVENGRFRRRFLQPGGEEELTRLQNRSFAGAWGYNPNTVDEMVLRTRLPGSSRKDIIIAF